MYIMFSTYCTEQTLQYYSLTVKTIFIHLGNHWTSQLRNWWISNYRLYDDLLVLKIRVSLTHWGRDKINTISQTTFSCAFFNENCCISIKFALKYVRNGPIDINQALVEIMAWCRSGGMPLSEPMMTSLPAHICVTRPRPQWVKSLKHIQKWYISLCKMIYLGKYMRSLLAEFIVIISLLWWRDKSTYIPNTLIWSYPYVGRSDAISTTLLL